MSKSAERQFKEADAAIERAVTGFVSKINQMPGRWEAVAWDYIVRTTLLELCEQITKLIDDPSLATYLGPAALKLSNALADYRDSAPEEQLRWLDSWRSRE
jgi:hypothetical protein